MCVDLGKEVESQRVGPFPSWRTLKSKVVIVTIERVLHIFYKSDGHELNLFQLNH